MIKSMKFKTFNSGELKISGWLKNQLKIQAEGLNGNLHKMWRDIRDSAWIGGESDSWERVPYWLDGFIPLAYLLNDDEMIAAVKKYIDGILAGQQEDGWLCPCSYTERCNYDTWAVLLITKVLCLYHDFSNDDRIIDALKRCLDNFNWHIIFNTLRGWGASRWFEGLIAVYWLYEKTQDKMLLTLAKKYRIQGVDWRKVITSGLLDELTDGWDHYSHIVNIAMMLKSEALLSLFDDSVDSDEFAELAYQYLTKRHGTAIGHFNGDECLSGKSPIQGAELCSIVELMYSYEVIFRITGKTKWLDRLEVLAFNSLPATLTPDMWAHQYVQMSNQTAAFPMSKQPFRTNNNEAHLFGLEPHYGCCTANFGQGFPKFALSTFMKADDGIASCAISPSSIKTTINGVEVSCECITEYPFKDSVKYIINTAEPIEFSFFIRIPQFAKNAHIDGENVKIGDFVKITKEWNGCTEINVTFEFETEIVERPNNLFCLKRGPLFYSIPINGKKERVEYWKDGVERKFPYCDYYIYPTSKWNYALAGDSFNAVEHDVSSVPFDPSKPPVTIEAKAAEIDWGFNNGHCDALPRSAVPVGEIQKIEFIPYGCTELRMTEIPKAEL